MLIIGFGHKARRGKDSVAQAIIEARGDKYDIRRYAFADRVKTEALTAFFNPNDAYWAFLDDTRNASIVGFIERVVVDDNGCWLWTGQINDRGYGLVHSAGSRHKVHRFMWEVLLGNDRVPLLRHTCDTRHCVNPLHLLEGTAQDNSTDMVERERSANGERHSQSTVSDATVARIRTLAAEGWANGEICEELDLTSSYVSRVVNNLTRVDLTYVPAETVVTSTFSSDWLVDAHKYKFRRMLQHWGTEYRRAQNPFYWVKALFKVILAEKPQVALITDMRFFNEMYAIKEHTADRVGFTVRLDRVGFDEHVGLTNHASEHELDAANVDGEQYDYAITVADGDLDRLLETGILLFDIIVDEITPPPAEAFTLEAMEQASANAAAV